MCWVCLWAAGPGIAHAGFGGPDNKGYFGCLGGGDFACTEASSRERLGQDSAPVHGMMQPVLAECEDVATEDTEMGQGEGSAAGIVLNNGFRDNSGGLLAVRTAGGLLTREKEDHSSQGVLHTFLPDSRACTTCRSCTGLPPRRFEGKTQASPTAYTPGTFVRMYLEVHTAQSSRHFLIASFLVGT